jgi:hypothetical protein
MKPNNRSRISRKTTPRLDVFASRSVICLFSFVAHVFDIAIGQVESASINQHRSVKVVT